MNILHLLFSWGTSLLKLKDSTMRYVKHRQYKWGSLLIGAYKLWGSCTNYKRIRLAMSDYRPSPWEYGKKLAWVRDVDGAGCFSSSGLAVHRMTMTWMDMQEVHFKLKYLYDGKKHKWPAKHSITISIGILPSVNTDFVNLQILNNFEIFTILYFYFSHNP